MPAYVRNWGKAEWNVYLFYTGGWTTFAHAGCISVLSFVIIQPAGVALSFFARGAISYFSSPI
jgi:hypothetical protein